MAMWEPAIVLLPKYHVLEVPWLTRLQALLFLAVTWLVFVPDVGCYLEELPLMNPLLGPYMFCFNANQALEVSPGICYGFMPSAKRVFGVSNWRVFGNFMPIGIWSRIYAVSFLSTE